MNIKKIIKDFFGLPQNNSFGVSGDYIDVYMSTFNRFKFFKKSFKSIFKACKYSSYRHRIVVIVDRVEFKTLLFVMRFYRYIHIVTIPDQLGLPFVFNLILNYARLMEGRSEITPKYICYIQDDCIVQDVNNFFSVLDAVYNETSKKNKVAYISGFYTPIHPGFDKIKANNLTVVLSDSLDGKHIMAPPYVFQSVGELSPTLPNGRRRGNPGPKYGSHFDLWQWKESPNSTMKQKMINVCIPGLVTTIACSANDSTWNNASDNSEYIKERIKVGKIYNTREEYPILEKTDYFKVLSNPDLKGQGLD